MCEQNRVPLKIWWGYLWEQAGSEPGHGLRLLKLAPTTHGNS